MDNLILEFEHMGTDRDATGRRLTALRNWKCKYTSQEKPATSQKSDTLIHEVQQMVKV
jgi:hypothetical protein